MDQGILVGLKKHYKIFLLRHLILEDQSSSLSASDVLKQLTIKDAVYWSAKAWNEITVENLKRGWNQLFSSCGISGNTTTTSGIDTTTSGIDNHAETSTGPSCSTSTSDTTTSTVPSTTTTVSTDSAFDVDTNNADFYEMFNSLGYSESNDGWQTPEQWLAEDANDPGHQMLSDDEIVVIVRREENDSENESDSDSEQEQPTISHAEACKAFSIGLQRLESQEEVEPTQLLLVKQWRDLAAKKRCDNLVQSNLLTFFSTQK